MTIAGLIARGKTFIEGAPRDLFVVLILILSCSASFGLGVLAGRDSGVGEGSSFSISQIPLAAATNPASIATTSMPTGGQVVASKNGTKYFLPWCGGAKQISDANKIWFASKEEAEAKGYQPALNCKGL
jgi:hypothetical protein